MSLTKTWQRVLLTVPLLFLMAAGSGATLLMEENFDYAVGQLTDNGGGANVSGGNWVDFSGTGNYVSVTAGSLSYTDYLSSGTGNKIAVVSATTSAEDVYRQFATQGASSTTHIGFLLNLANTTGLTANSSTTGDYFVSLLPSASITSYVGRITIRLGSAAGTYQLGIRATSSNTEAVWLTNNLTPGVTYLVVMAYQLNPDHCWLWINPTLSGSQPVADIEQAAAATVTDIGRVAIRQGYTAGPPALATPNADIDGFRVGTSWADISGTNPTGPNVLSTTPANGASGVLPQAMVSVTFDRPLNWTTMDTSSFMVNGKRQAYYPADSIRPAANSTTYTYYVRDSLLLADTVTVTLTTAIVDTAGENLAVPYVWQFQTFVPDTTPPLVLSTVPTDGQINVQVSSSVTVNFSEALLPSTVDTAAFFLTGRRAARYRIKTPVLSNGNTRVTIQPLDSFLLRDTVTVGILPSLTDSSGNALRDTSFSFSTRNNPNLTVFDIQYTTDPSGNSPYSGQNVTVSGVVTGVVRVGNSKGMYFIQDGTGPWNGVYCYDRDRFPEEGDSVKVSGTVIEYFGLTEISPVSGFQLLKKGTLVPDPVVLPTDSLSSNNPNAEAYEGVLVATNRVNVTSLPNSYYEWDVNDGSGPCIMDDFLDSLSHMGYTPVIGDSLIRVQGIFHSSFGWKIEHRFPRDIVQFKPVKMLSSLPAQGNINVPTQVGIRLNFDKPLDQATIIVANFSVNGSSSAAHDLSLSYNSADYSIRLIPTAAFSAGETVSVWISHSLRDTLGFYLDGNQNGTASNDSLDDISFSFVTLLNPTRIAEVQKPGSDGFTPLLVGQTVTVEGIVSGPDMYFTSSTASTASWYLDDGTGGVNVYGGTKGQFVLGRRAVVTGKVTEYNGVTEVASTAAQIALWDWADQPVSPRMMIYNQLLGETIEGQLASVEGTISSIPAYAGGGYNMEMRNGNAPIAVRIVEISGFDMSPMTYGAKVRVTGIVSQYDKEFPYNSGYQLVPRFAQDYFYNGVLYPPDIEVLFDSTAASASSQIVSVKPNPFSPEWGEVGIIEINAPDTDHLTLRIYDLKGRLVKTCLNNVPGGHQYYYWNGTDNSNRRTNIGMYIAHLRSVTAEGGISDKTKIIVLGTPLK
ncbi:MAG: Ig-like domain-containing protein [Candidatus Edwardsbacteria bacterium]|nr:Ig-like domain-containing protein [Candidatus Edwardsbacteria bacterium]MBU1577129.1 Ig-like domain-containing protein [Candidatus Edwardsbacteria bacterium]MBU2463793.1 Ig-like domain-containing protein [Candidatus Edwardsbacteria bacterium]MBU2593775.1 Ig-like domain-containing protein [Candidatus Edwardsbacteria bacterium]